MSECRLCPRRCGADREAGQRGFCGVDATLRVARAALHPWEEPVISGSRGSGTIFFSGCNLRCVFCQNVGVSHGAQGRPMSVEELGEQMLSLQAQGAHNINLVTPTHYAPAIAAALRQVKGELKIPVVYNSGGYDSPEVLSALAGLVDIYLPDLKYYSSELSMSYSGASDYFEVAMAAIREMVDQVGAPRIGPGGLMQRGVIVRHLILPGCRRDSIALMEELGARFAPEELLVSLMSQYTPDFLPADCAYENLRRRVTTMEYESVVKVVSRLGFDGFTQGRSSATAAYTPPFFK